MTPTESVAEIASRIGAADFFERTINALCSSGGYDCGEAILFRRGRQPDVITSRINLDGRRIAPEAYLRTYFRTDPLYVAFLDGAAAGCYALSHLAPDLLHTRYFTEYYGLTLITNELDFLIPVSSDVAFALWVGCHRSSIGERLPNPGPIAAIEPILRSMVGRHVSLTGLSRGATYQRPQIATMIEHTFERFGDSFLSARERQILRYTILGYSAALTAERLGVAEGTVKNHRKNIHRKLDIRTQAELFSLFLNALPYADDEEDPLAAYQRNSIPILAL